MEAVLNKKLGKAFHIIWFGQLVSQLGTATTSFALLVWMAQNGQSTTAFALGLVWFFLPSAILSPWIGGIVDRFNLKKLAIVSDLLAGVFTVVMLLLAYFDVLEMWHIYIMAVFSSVPSLLQRTTFTVLIPKLVGSELIGKANARFTIIDAGSRVVSALLATSLLSVVGLAGVMLIDLLTLLVAVLSLLLVKLPKEVCEPVKKSDGDSASWRFSDNVMPVVNELKSSPFLLMVLTYLLAANFITSLVTGLMAPMLLASFTVESIGVLMSVGAVGALVGAVILSAKTPKRLVLWMFSINIVSGILIILAGITTHLPLMYITVFVMMFISPLMSVCDRTFWQQRINESIRGRFFALQGAMYMTVFPVATLVGGGLADGVFAPILSYLSQSGDLLPTWFGDQKGRELGLMYAAVGGIAVVFSIAILVWWKLSAYRNDGKFISTEASSLS